MAMKPNDQEIGELYREGGANGPSAELDRIILAAARQAVAPRISPAPTWWSRWRLPTQLLATICLVAMLAMLIEQKQPDAPSIGPLAMNTAAPAAKLADNAPLPPSTAPTSARAESASRRATAPAASKQALPTAAGAPLQAPALPQAADMATQSASAKAIPAESRLERNMDKAEAAGNVEPRAAARQASAPVARPILPAREWLESIQKLIAEERIEEARTSLARFRENYPEAVVPEVMRSRLQP